MAAYDRGERLWTATFAAIVVASAIAVGVIAYTRSAYDRRMASDPTVLRLKRLLMPYFPQLDAVELQRGTSSYTLDKKRIFLCVERDGQTYDDNTMTYVLLHELAHTMTRQIGHGSEFHAQFTALLDRAARFGLYDPTRPRVRNYCAAAPPPR
jgi:hypothetical protein